MSTSYQAIRAVLGLCLLTGVMAGKVDAQVCATVKIQIEQELSLERQGFIARMGIQNSPEFPMQDIVVTVYFSDRNGNAVLSTSDPGQTNALFFIRTEGTHPGSISAGASANLEWLIIPNPGAGGEKPEGELYYVGATLNYTSGGREEEIRVTPDFIYVKPMPLLQLDYFLPGEVYGDDPQTQVIEPSVPFSLGVRVKNNGKGFARNVKIQSGQPRIIENLQGLLVNFAVTGSEVNGQAGQNSLLVDFGTIPSESSGVARWIMLSSLSGTFTNFTATFSHADELGGAVTSLIPPDGIRTHTLVRDVLVDLPERDSVRDFLAYDGAALKVFESQNEDSPVHNASTNAVLNGAGDTRILSMDGGQTGFVYAKLSDPFNGTKIISAAQRSDGKAIPRANAWNSKTWDKTLKVWNHFIHLFDVERGQNTYTLTFVTPDNLNRPPELVVPPNLILNAGQTYQYTIRGTDPDGIKPEITVSGLPVGAVLNDATPSTGAETVKTLEWTPQAAQIGNYTLRFKASDGVNETMRLVQVSVINGANRRDAWREQQWPGQTNQEVIGDLADPDGDGLSNLLEYALNLDPKTPNAGGYTMIGIDEVNGLKYLTLTYVRRTDDPSLIFTVLGSDLAHAGDEAWTPQTQSVEVAQDGVPEGMLRVKVRDQVAIENGPARRYLKLKVSTGVGQ